MTNEELLRELDEVIEDSKTAILATTDMQGKSHTRWMTPIILNYRPGIIFACSMRKTPKIDHIIQNTTVEWMFQTRDLRKVINASGKAFVIENPSLRSELIENAGDRLAAFWKANIGEEDFVIIQTIIECAQYFEPVNGHREFITF